MGVRLLPDKPEIGWTPYLWLVYLSFFLLEPLATGLDARLGSATALAIALFLYLYFRGYWLRGRALLGVIAGMAAIGALFLPLNPGASVFFIYAAACTGFLGRPAAAVRLLVVLAASLALEGWWLGVPGWGWGPAVVVLLVVGGANIHFAEVERAHRRLRLAHEEIERLAKLAERERIARDLHDLLGHTLSLITLKAELAARLAERDPAAAAAEIRAVERISREALAEVRQAVRGYRGGGLAVELANARLALASAGVELEEEVASPPLAAAAESALALVLREAVTNVVRHAAARRCRVALARRGEELVLEVGDDGRGGLAAEGAGLTGMRERVASLGGRLEREGGSGTVLRVTLPLAAGTPAARRSSEPAAAAQQPSAQQPSEVTPLIAAEAR